MMGRPVKCHRMRTGERRTAVFVIGGSLPGRRADGETQVMLQRRWAGAEFPAWISTASGERLRLLYPGTWNLGPGPDFRDARLLAESGHLLRGDVELHRRERDWVAHGHDRDPAYAEVVLHVLGAGRRRLCEGSAPEEEIRAAKAGTGPARVIVLPAIASERPPAVPSARLPCHDVVRRGGRAAVEARLQRLAVERRRRKVASLRWPSGTGRAASADDVAYRALLGALGQADNRAALERLALPLTELRGLDRNMISERLLVEAERLERASVVRWERRGRPANRLEARLSAAAALLAEMLPELARKLTGLAFLEPREAVGALRVPGLLGPGRASQLLVDCCYPLALAYPDLVARSGAGERTGRSTAWGLMQRWLDLPGAKYQHTASLRTRLADQGHNSWRNGASQALLDLQSDHCRLGGCAVCPLGRLAREPVARSARPSTNI